MGRVVGVVVGVVVGRVVGVVVGAVVGGTISRLIPARRARSSSSASFELSEGEKVPRLMAAPKIREILDPTAFNARSTSGNLRAKSGSLAAFATTRYKAELARSSAAAYPGDDGDGRACANPTLASSSEIICAICESTEGSPTISARSASVIEPVSANRPSSVTKPASDKTSVTLCCLVLYSAGVILLPYRETAFCFSSSDAQPAFTARSVSTWYLTASDPIWIALWRS